MWGPKINEFSFNKSHPPMLIPPLTGHCAPFLLQQKPAELKEQKKALQALKWLLNFQEFNLIEGLKGSNMSSQEKQTLLALQ